jgi:hypothetical protein
MKKLLPLISLLSLFSTLAIAQKVEPLKLKAEDIPEAYQITDKLLCKSIQAALLYESPDMYSMILGNVVEKGYQSFEEKKDKGTILYFIFDQDITDNAFIPGLLWGSAEKPTKAHPEEFIAKGNTLIVWSFDKDSTIKKLLREKVAKNL